MTSRALVLGGGGVAGIAWELGLALGLAEHGVDVSAADLVVGTSAGSVVGALVGSGVPLQELYDAQLDETRNTERAVDFDAERLMTEMGEALQGVTDQRQARARIGGVALAARTVSEEERLAIVRSRLPVGQWPAQRLVITAVDAESGEFTTFDAGSGVALVDAVAASCAVPGIWPPVTIGGRRYIDGGMRTVTNAGLAAGCDVVLVLAPFPAQASLLGPSTAEEVAELERNGARVAVVTADDESTRIFGTNPLDPSTRAPSARAGLAQGRSVGAEVARTWTG